MQRIFLIIITAFISTAWAAPAVLLNPPTVLVYNINSAQTIISNNAELIRPMASITKLMTAMVALDYFRLEDRIKIGKTRGDTAATLITRLLVRSDNQASEILARAYPGGRLQFLAAMNAKTIILGLNNTQFNDPSGLLASNTSTAHDLVKLLAASGNYEFILQVSSRPEIYETVWTKKKSTVVTLPNTNRNILFDFNNILVSKTGFTSRAGRCLAMLIDKQGERYAIIILGEPSSKSREAVARNLLTFTLF